MTKQSNNYPLGNNQKPGAVPPTSDTVKKSRDPAQNKKDKK
jgi:hypothetical protein